MEKYHSDQEYEEIITDQLGDMQLRENLRSAMDTLRANRKNLIKNRYSEWENLRELGKEVKLKILSRLDEYLELFEKTPPKTALKSITLKTAMKLMKSFTTSLKKRISIAF